MCAFPTILGVWWVFGALLAWCSSSFLHLLRSAVLHRDTLVSCEQVPIPPHTAWYHRNPHDYCWLQNQGLLVHQSKISWLSPPTHPASLFIWQCFSSTNASHNLCHGFGWSINSGYYKSRKKPIETSRNSISKCVSRVLCSTNFILPYSSWLILSSTYLIFWAD